MITILCDAGKDTIGRERKLALYIDQDGRLHDVKMGWPSMSDGEAGLKLKWGPILRITPEEYVFQLQIALGTGV